MLKTGHRHHLIPKELIAPRLYHKNTSLHGHATLLPSIRSGTLMGMVLTNA
jgi:hypothetical protein